MVWLWPWPFKLTLPKISGQCINAQHNTNAYMLTYYTIHFKTQSFNAPWWHDGPKSRFLTTFALIMTSTFWPQKLISSWKLQIWSNSPKYYELIQAKLNIMKQNRAFHVIRPGNGSSLFHTSWGPHKAQNVYISITVINHNNTTPPTIISEIRT